MVRDGVRARAAGRAAWAVAIGVCLAWHGLSPRQAVARAQPEPQGNPVYVDEWATATETIQGLPSQLAAGNLDGAVRVLQRLLNDEPVGVVATADDPDLFVSVRALAMAHLLAKPALLARYREVEGPKAERALEEQGAERVERSWLLTTAGYEGALRVAQGQFERAQFNAAWLTLRQLDSHPDRTGAGAAEAADLLARVARYIDRAEVCDLAIKWGREAGHPIAGIKAEPWPALASRRGLSPLEPSPPVTLQGMVAKPLWTVMVGAGALVALGQDGKNGRINPNNPQQGEQAPAGARYLWILPAAAGDTVYANDGATIWAWDRFTLSKRWSVSPMVEPHAAPEAAPGGDPRRFRPMPRARSWSNSIEDPATVVVSGRDVIAVTGLAIDTRRDNEAIHAIDADSGRIRWSVQLADLDAVLAQASVRGAPMVGEGTVVLAVRKVSQMQRLASLYLIGLDQGTGRLKWRRLVGSAGALPYGQMSPMVDGGLLVDGVVYRTDQLGVHAAYEAATGRPLWVRRNDTQSPLTQGMSHPWEVSMPVVDGRSIVTLSPDRREIVRLDRRTGRRLGARASSDFSTPAPDYVLRVGDTLAAVGPTRISLAGIGDFDKPGSTIRQIARLQDPGIRGRVVVAGSRLIVPTAGGVAVIDPSDAAGRVEAIALEKPGNVLALPSQLLVADDTHIHSYLLWGEAERVLNARMQADPSDPGPAGTFAELAYRAGRPAQILPAVDTAVKAIEAGERSSPTVEPARRRLLDAILGMVNTSQEPDARAATEGLGVPSGKITDPQLLGELIERLGRVAVAADEKASHQLALGRYRESRADSRGAVEMYQRILDDPALAGATWTGPQVSLRAELEATWRLERMVQEQGPGVYAVHEAQARAELAALGQDPTIEAMATFVRRYPVASIVPATWLRLAGRHEAEDRPQAAAAALESGLRAGGRRSDTDPVVLGQLGGRLVRALERRGQYGAAAAVLRQMRDRFPRAPLADASGPIDGTVLLAGLGQRLAESARWPRIGQIRSDGAQAVPGWTLMRPLRRDVTGRVSRCLVMENGEEVGVWACARDAGGGDGGECSGELTKVWSMPTAGADASLMCIQGDAVFLFMETPAGGSVLAVSISKGEMAWKSEPFGSLFHAEAAPAGPNEQARNDGPGMIQTPLDGPTSGAAVVWSLDERTVSLVERAGRAAAFDAQNGRLLWAARTPVSRVFDTDLREGVLIVAGDQDPPADAAGASGPAPVIVAIDARTGQIGQRISPQHGQVRWVNLMQGGTLLAGMEKAIASFDVARGQTNWAATDPNLQMSQQAWVLGERVFVATSETPIRSMWSLAVRDGRTGPQSVRIPPEHMDAAQPIYAAMVRGPRGQDAVALSTMHGVAILSAAGDLIGMDALGGLDALIPAQAADGALVTAETVASSREPDGQMDFAVHVLDSASAKILQTRSVVLGARPRRIALLDGRIAITAGGSTVILRAPAGDK